MAFAVLRLDDDERQGVRDRILTLVERTDDAR
jgi:hypothetical protein